MNKKEQDLGSVQFTCQLYCLAGLCYDCCVPQFPHLCNGARSTDLTGLARGFHLVSPSRGFSEGTYFSCGRVSLNPLFRLSLPSPK